MKRKRLSSDEIKIKLRRMENFVVNSDSERKRALMIASVLNIEIITRKADGGGFRIFIPSDVLN